MLKVFEAFSGYGSQSLALKRVGIEHKVIGISEIDEVAIKAYYALHNEYPIKNYGDIRGINPKELGVFDLFTYSFPCTDLSLSGKLGGLERGKTSSGLLYECEKIIQECRPKYLLMENVKSLVGSRFNTKFEEWVAFLKDLGYSSQWFILNAKDFGIPQSRERVFCVSQLGENEPMNFIQLAMAKANKSCVLRDYLDSKELSDALSFVPIAQEIAIRRLSQEDSIKEFSYFSGIAPQYYREFYKEKIGLWGNGAYRGRYNNEGKIEQRLELREDGVCNTLTSVAKDNVIVCNGFVRYLTEREYGRLMGLTEQEINKILKLGISKHKLYKLFGNSIVIPCLEEIFKAMF